MEKYLDREGGGGAEDNDTLPLLGIAGRGGAGERKMMRGGWEAEEKRRRGQFGFHSSLI